jgi:hypothetical protein
MEIPDKKAIELNHCKPVVDEINRLEGTDFEATSGQAEPNDVVFKSRSGKYRDRGVQVVTTPKGHLNMRTDNHNIQRFEKDLLRCLARCGIADAIVTISAAPQAVLHGVEMNTVETVCRLIRDRYKSGNFRLTPGELDPQVSAAVEAVSVFACPGLNGVSLDLLPTFGGAVPSDDKWIRDAIESKSKKYGGTKAVRDLILVIVSPLFVDQQQIDYFRAAHPDTSALPFSEIWLSTWRGPTRLKP